MTPRPGIRAVTVCKRLNQMLPLNADHLDINHKVCLDIEVWYGMLLLGYGLDF